MRPYKEIVLEQPITAGQGRNAKTHTSIVIRQPIARDLSRAAKAKSTIDAILTFISGTSGLPMSVVMQLSEPDVNQCIAFYDEIGSLQLSPAKQGEPVKDANDFGVSVTGAIAPLTIRI